MGTQQVQYGFLQAPRRTINYQQGLEEIGKLSAQSLGKVSTINVLADNRNGPLTSLDLQLESDVDRHYIPGENRPVDAITGRLNLLLTDSCRLQTVNLSINCVDSLLIATPSEAVLQLDSKLNKRFKNEQEFILIYLQGEGQASLAVSFHANKKNGIVSSLQVEISAVIGASWTTTKHLNLPLKLVTKLTTPVREALVKVTLAINQPADSLVQLFNELQVDDSMSNVMAFEHLDGTRVSILVSKTTNKYRIQSDSLAALALPVAELQRRLKTAKVVLDSALPVQETWHRIEHHYATWLELKSQMVMLFVKIIFLLPLIFNRILLKKGKFESSHPTVSDNTTPVSQQDSQYKDGRGHTGRLERIATSSRSRYRLYRQSGAITRGKSVTKKRFTIHN